MNKQGLLERVEADIKQTFELYHNLGITESQAGDLWGGFQNAWIAFSYESVKANQAGQTELEDLFDKVCNKYAQAMLTVENYAKKEKGDVMSEYIKQNLKLCEDLGRAAFHHGIKSPAFDPYLMYLIECNPDKKVGSSIPMLKAWNKGYHLENLKAK